MATATADDGKLTPELCGIAGEYFVAAELSRRGYIAAVTLRNTRGADVLVSHPARWKTATVQVKTQQRGKTEWMLNKSDETPKGEDHFYVFVALNGRDGVPEYHVVPGNYVAQWCADNHQRWLSGTKKDGSQRKDSSIRVFRPGEDFRNNWDAIRA